MLTDVAYADARAIVRDALAAYLPPDVVDVATHAAGNRWLDNRGGGYVGRWSHDQAPYLTAPMEALTSRDYLTVAVPGPARTGKTEIAKNWLLQAVDVDPADMLLFQQTDAVIESFVKREIHPLIEAHDVLRDRLGSMPIDRSLHFKRFRGMWLELLAATYNNLIGKSAPRIVLDETDAYDPALGDVIELASLRRTTFGRESMLYATSHPDRAAGSEPSQWRDGIMRAYRTSTRCVWWWPCPHCNAWSSPNPTASRVMTLHYPADAPIDEIADATRLICPTCGGLVEDRARRTMNRDGRWIGLGQEIDVEGVVTGELVRRDTAGFWIVGPMSPFLLGGIGGLARSLVEAQRECDATGDDAQLREVRVKKFGIPHDSARRVGALDAETLISRTEPSLSLRRIPPDVRFLTAAVDVQGNRFEWLVRGWGVGGESWIVDTRTQLASPAIDPLCWDALLKELSEKAYPLDDGSGRHMAIRAIGYDSGGQAGVTSQAYDAWRRARKLGQARLLGRYEGREAWTVMPLKGIGTPNPPRLVVVYPDSARKDRQATARGEVPTAQFSPNRYKDDLANQLARADAGPGAVHFPAAMASGSPPHVFFEQLVAERRHDSGKWEKVTAAIRNEALDLMVMTHVMADLFGLRTINWLQPPAWAAEWFDNALITAADSKPAAPRPPRSITDVIAS